MGKRKIRIRGCLESTARTRRSDKIEPAFQPWSICIELAVNAGYLTTSLLPPAGDLALVECNFWRNLVPASYIKKTPKETAWYVAKNGTYFSANGLVAVATRGEGWARAIEAFQA